jgi:serine/threonine protein kinase/regulator of sirC expression with transglutaminase-like and TPR domain
MPLVPNQQLFEYRIERILGKGAFGTVYLAHDELLGRPVAIKELTLTAQTDEVAFKRFLQEARAAGNLNHPHIVTVHTLKVVELNVYLVMEYLAGGSLRTLLEKQSPLPVGETMRITADVCEGLAAAHAKGIVHRDVKPENILLMEDGRAKVGDFGIAHVPRGAGGTSLTQTGFQPGTLLYMSPEQIRGQPVDGWSDVYQVGALLYEMLTGRHYVDLGALERRAREMAGSNVMLLQARLYELLAETICEQEPEGVCRIRPEVPDWLGEVVVATLVKEPTGRPAADALARALRSGEAAQTASATRPDVVVSIRVGADLPVDHDEESMNLDNWYNIAGIMFMERGHWDKAAGAFQNALGVNPDRATLHHNLGLAYLQMGHLDEALCEFQVAQRLAPNDAEGHVSLGLVYAQLGRLDEAIREYRAALRIDPNTARAYLNIGKVYSEQGQYDNAVTSFSRAIELDPQLGSAYSRRGKLYEKLGEYLKAIVDFSRFIEIKPEQDWYWQRRAQLHRLTGREDLALAGFERAIELCASQIGSRPDDSRGYNARAWSLAQIGRIEEALRDAHRAIELDDKKGYHFGTRGTIYALEGNLELALRDFDRCLELAPTDAVDYYLRSYVRRSLGDDAGADQDVSRAKELDPYVENDPDALVLERSVRK